jgi:heat shock protein HslJ
MKLAPILRLAALVLLPLLPACGLGDVKREPPPLPFVGTKWMLVTERKVTGELPYLEFGDGAVSGFSGCNRVMGRYIQDTVGAGAIVFSSISSTKRLCDDPLMAIESRMLSVLRSSTNVRVMADTLRIDGSAGALDFRADIAPVQAAQPPANVK